MEYKCSIYDKSTGTMDCWYISLRIISTTGSFTEFEVKGHGSSIHAITGPQENGTFLCLPEYGVGSDLAFYTDWFWNWEKLSRLVGVTDAATLSTALKYLKTSV